MSTKGKSWLGAILGLVLVLGVITAIKVAQIKSMISAGKAMKPPPVAVTSAAVQSLELEQTTPAIASLVAVHGGTLGAELPGLVREIHFESGTFVKRGSALVQLDSSVEEAQLEGAQAESALARIELERVRTLRRTGAVSPADLDRAEAQAKQTAAAVSSLEATLAKKTIRAPFDGRIAIRQVELGQVVAPGTPIASLQSVDPIHADFWLPQDALATLVAGQPARLHVDVAADRTWEGTVTTINPEVDSATRNVHVRATFANADGFLRPGLFGRLEVIAPAKKAALVIPATAVLYAPYGDSVFVIDKQGDGALIAKQRFVRVGEHHGDFVVVATGLSAGDAVVGTGAFKLHGDTAVIVNNSLAPAQSFTPKPKDE